MKKFFRFIFKTFLILLFVGLGLFAINSETDFFENIGSYIPSVEEKYPEMTQKIVDLSKDISALSHQIPSLKEIVSIIKGEEMPLDPADVATNAYIKDSPMLSFCPVENISLKVTDDNRLEVFGVVNSYENSHLIVCFTDLVGEVLAQVPISADSSYEFNEFIKIPETEYNELDVSVYTGSKPYGDFVSWIYNYVSIIKNDNGEWELKKSPVLAHNITMYEKDKSISEALESTLSIQSEYSNIQSLAQQLVLDYTTDYEKAMALHDWVCSYLYYDRDSLVGEETAPYFATEVINRRRAVCLGYATLYAALCRSIGIPCNVVSGYALGVDSGETIWNDRNIYTDESNHAWNEVYVDGRWMIVDTTWDSNNVYENGQFVEGENVSHLYFDANIDFFSGNHKILEYTTRR